MPEKVIEVKNLSFSYKREEPLIRDLSFDVFKGEFFGIVGPNGAGKSTLIKLLLGFLKPQNGKVFLLGQKIEHFRQWNKVGYVPQRFSVEKTFTGNVGELLKAIAPEERVGWIIAFLHLENILHRPFIKLSGGEQQKVLLAMALTKNPEILFLDEPMTGLDIHAQEHIQEVLKEVSKDRTVVVVSHDVGFVLKNATRILCLSMPFCGVVRPEKFESLIRELYGLH